VLGCYYLTYNRPSTANEKPRVFSSLEEAIMALDAGSISLQTNVRLPFRGEQRQTTIGRILFNEMFPADFPFQDDPMTKKTLKKTMAKVYAKYGQERTAEIADTLKDLSFRYATQSGLSVGMTDFEPVEGLADAIREGDEQTAAIAKQYAEGFITNDERIRLTIDTWTKVETTVQGMLVDQLKGRDTSTAIAVESGARGSVSQMLKVVGMLGVMQDATGKVIELPVKSGYVAGLDPLEYFTGTRGTRKALIDIALKTADAGYLTRRLVDVAQDVFTLEDGADDPGFDMHRSDAEEIGVPFASRLAGRYAAEEVPGYVQADELITQEVADKIDADKSISSVKIMSVLSSTSVRGVGRKSYGVDPATGVLVADHAPVGVVAAQSIGEPSTQLSLDSKHRSGALVADDAAQGLTRIEELFEARTPKGQAYLTEIAGTVHAWEEGDYYVVQVNADESASVTFTLGERKPQVAGGSDVMIGDVIAALEDGSEPIVAPIAGKIEVAKKQLILTPSRQSAVRYEIPGYKQLLVKDGDKVVAGQRLTNGSINLQDLMRLQGVAATQRYIMTEMLKIFAAQGQNIADKHLEVIVRQMFGRVQIEDAADSEFVTGDVVSRQAVIEVNEQLIADGKEPAVYNQLLLGLIKASLSTDSFLSAASFQDTTRVLIAAATSGKVDKLYGLKENVIIGRKIPVGTGVKRPAEETTAELDEPVAA
jgi:DNA-directed RNA polymerase subunit beta'